MKPGFNHLFLILSIIILVGCTALPVGQVSLEPTRIVTLSPTAGLVFETVQAPTPGTPNQSIQPTRPADGTELRIWVPPEFNPLGNSQAGSILKARLDEFSSQNPGTTIDVRLKDLQGEGGMLESLVSTSVTAPLALPDMVLLPRPLLESATLKGLLYPFDGLTNIMDDPNWYEYARQMAHVQSGTYGIPFAGDVMALIYHPSLRSTPPTDLENALSLGEAMLFPATDPQSLVTLNAYLADGGSLQDEQGRPTLDQAVLTRVLEFDQRASQGGLMPYWLTQYSTDAQVWEAFLGNRYPMAISWVSSYLNPKLTGTSDLALAPIPTASGDSYALATGWSWALSGQDPTRRHQAVKLAEFLADKDFLAAWTSAAGSLPPRADSLQSWPESADREVIQAISSSAHLMPPVDVISSLGPALEQALVDILKAQTDPQSAAAAAASRVNQP